MLIGMRLGKVCAILSLNTHVKYLNSALFAKVQLRLYAIWVEPTAVHSGAEPYLNTRHYSKSN